MFLGLLPLRGAVGQREREEALSGRAPGSRDYWLEDRGGAFCWGGLLLLGAAGRSLFPGELTKPPAPPFGWPPA